MAALQLDQLFYPARCSGSPVLSAGQHVQKWETRSDRTTSSISLWPLTHPSSPTPKACWLLVISIEKTTINSIWAVLAAPRNLNWPHLHPWAKPWSVSMPLGGGWQQHLRPEWGTSTWQVRDWAELHCSDWPACTHSEATQEEIVMTAFHISACCEIWVLFA